MSERITLAGGWGYENLGDEAILAGYAEFLEPRVEFEVASVDPRRTRAAQRFPLNVIAEGSRSDAGGPLLLGGGGYLNGRWLPEIYGKLFRLGRVRSDREVYAHGIEVRRMDHPLQARMLRRVLGGGSVAVRDAESAEVLARAVQLEPQVLPDAISLLYPHLDKYVKILDWARGKVVINLLDIQSRGDSDESEIDVLGWNRFVDELLSVLGDRALLLVVGDGDRAYINSRHPRATIVEPKGVVELVSILALAKAVISVRMHPGLLASALATPVVSIPYCGKVRPTLERLGLGESILNDLDVELALSMLETNIDHTRQWESAYAKNEDWLVEMLNSSKDANGLD